MKKLSSNVIVRCLVNIGNMNILHLDKCRGHFFGGDEGGMGRL